MKKGKYFSQGLYAVVALFLMYTGYDLFRGRNDPETTMSPAMVIVFAVFFAAAGIALLVYAILTGRRMKQEEEISDTDVK